MNRIGPGHNRLHLLVSSRWKVGAQEDRNLNRHVGAALAAVRGADGLS
ncbi:hypothetical protein BH23CHL2_BH23CHL2_30570 [soil metagenome]